MRDQRALTEIADSGCIDASSEENESKIRMAGVHAALFQVLQKHVDCLEILRQGIRVLGNLSHLMGRPKS